MHKFLRSALLAISSLAVAAASFATTPVGYVMMSASHLQDSTGTVVANATISFTPVTNAGLPISY